MSRPSSARSSGSSTNATFTHHSLDHPFAQGAFRWVALGKYTDGSRSGEQCVCKWFKSGTVFEEDFYTHDIKAAGKAKELVDRWNAERIVDNMCYMNVPAVWTFKPGSRWAGSKHLLEPHIANFEKFNSNSGWHNSGVPWGRVMQALSHFSYHATGGNMLLCDLQGGVYRDGVVLTDPVILSRRRDYGVTDLGARGISTFFSTHQCNEYCRSHWQTPRDQSQYYQPTQGTSMMMLPAGHVPTRNTRAPLSHANGLGGIPEAPLYD